MNKSVITSERNVNDGALEGHQAGQGHNLRLIDVFTVTNTTLARKTVVAVLHTVTFNDFDIISSLLLLARKESVRAILVARRVTYSINVGPDGELNTVDRGTTTSKENNVSMA